MCLTDLSDDVHMINLFSRVGLNQHDKLERPMAFHSSSDTWTPTNFQPVHIFLTQQFGRSPAGATELRKARNRAGLFSSFTHRFGDPSPSRLNRPLLDQLIDDRLEGLTHASPGGVWSGAGHRIGPMADWIGGSEFMDRVFDHVSSGGQGCSNSQQYCSKQVQAKGAVGH